jgi:hypothetical protein
MAHPVYAPRLMASTFTIKQGDLAPPLQATLTDSKNQKMNLTGNLGIQFQMKLRQHAQNEAVALKVDAAGSVVGAATDGVVKYEWVGADTDTIGEYIAEFKVTQSDGKPRTVPNPTFITVRVVADI